MKKSRKILIGILICVIIGSVFYIGYYYVTQNKNEKVYKKLQKEVVKQESKEEEPQTEESHVEIPIDFAQLQAQNPDIYAWIQIDGTEINYPVVQGTDNQYYLKHLFEGKWNSSGCIFLDSRVAEDLSDRHSIIYGHHMKNGSMFSGLTKYKEQQYYEAHPSGYLLMPDENYTIEFFAGYVASANADAWNLDFESDEEYMAWIDRAIEQSCFESPVRPVADSRIVTLSTCSYEFKNARFILLGIIK